MARNNEREERAPAAPVTALAAPRLSMTPELYEKLEIDEGMFRVLVDQVFPNAKTVEAVVMALTYCRSRNLDIMKRPVHIVPMYSSQLRRMVETVWPSIAEIRTTAARTGEYAGLDEIEYGPEETRVFTMIETDDRGNETGRKEVSVTFPTWARATCYRMVKGYRASFTARVRWMEAYATASRWTDMPNDMWRRRTYGQIDKVAEAAVLRLAFPEEVGNQYAAEEMEGQTITYSDATASAEPAKAPARRGPPPAPKQDAVAAEGEEIEDGQFEEVDKPETVEKAPPVAETASAAPSERKGPPPAPKPAPAPAATQSAPPADGKKTLGMIKIELRDKFDRCETVDDWRETWEEYDYLQEKLSEEGWAALETIAMNARDAIELQSGSAATLGAG